MSTQLALGLGVVILLGWYFWTLRRGRGKLAQGLREHASVSSWWPFMSGYLAALDDIERTGLRPMTDDAQRRSAERAFRRRYIERLSAASDQEQKS